MTTEQECIEALHEAAEQLGESPSRGQYDELGLTPAGATIMRTLGGWNAAKERAGLPTDSASGSRMIEPPEHIDSEVRDRWEHLSVDQRWYYRNRKRKNRSKVYQRNELRARAARYKVQAGCCVCGESEPGCLDFHHRDGDEKERSISKMISYYSSWNRIEAEIRKCDVLCANCHRKEHYEPPLGYTMDDLRP
jgi:hypothetical protein